MTAKIIDGVAIAKVVKEECRNRVEILKSKGTTPGLAVVIVGEDPASKVYVRNKIHACEEVGIHSAIHEFPGTASQQEIITCVRGLNQDPAIHGILVQLPLPAGIESRRVLEGIAAEKDVDGFHLRNVGALTVGEPALPPCTPAGIVRMLEHEKIAIWGQNAVIVGASNIVGKPAALMLLQRGATVSLCNSKTQNLAQYTIMADILVVATGRPGIITGPMVKKGATVIDVGINRLSNGKLVGDVDFEGARNRATYITPVPGGVGPMTVACLVSNTVQAAERAAGI